MTVIDDLADRTDADLIKATRAGDDQAYAELWTRHQPAALRQARALTTNDPEDLVSEAFSRILVVLRGGGGPEAAFRPYLLTAVRRLSIDRAKSAQQREVPTGDETDLDVPTQESLEGQHVKGVDAALAWSAWSSLPEPTRALLWHAVVEEERPADIARTLGVSANSVASRTKRARERLRQAYLSEHAAATDDEECRRVRARLGSYVRHGVSPRGSRQIRDHLHHCRECRAAYAEVRNVDSMVLGTVAAIITGAAALYAISRVLAPTTAAAATINPISGSGGGSGAGASGGGAGVVDKLLPSRVAELASTSAGRVIIGLTAVGTVTVVAVMAFARQPPPTPSSTQPAAQQTVAAPVPAPSSSQSVAPSPSRKTQPSPSRRTQSTPAATAPIRQALDLSGPRDTATNGTTQPQPTGTAVSSHAQQTPAPTRSGAPDTSAPPATTTSPSPTTRTPTATQTGAGPTSAEPTSAEPTSAEPTSAEPTSAEPTSAEPTSTGPSSAGPSSAGPTSAEPTSAEPTSTEPTSAEPTSTEPTSAEPTSTEPTSAGPTSTCEFIAATDWIYHAALVVPQGFLITSVQDIHNGQPFEHLDTPSQSFEHLVMPGPLTVVVQRVGDGEGSLQATFTTVTGRPLGGGGNCPLT